MLTRDHEDFADLHALISAAGGHHPGILLGALRQRTANNLSQRAIATAMMNLKASGVAIADQVHVLNHWR